MKNKSDLPANTEIEGYPLEDWAGYPFAHWESSRMSALDLEEKSMKPLVIFYTKRKSYLSGTTLLGYVERILDNDSIIVSDWHSLVLAIAQDPVAVIFDPSLVEDGVEYEQFASDIVRLGTRTRTRISIGAFIDITDGHDLIEKLRKDSIRGLVPNPEHFGIDALVECLRNVMLGETNWPNDIIRCLPKVTHAKKIKKTKKPAAAVSSVVEDASLAKIQVDVWPNLVYFRYNHSTSPKCTTALSEKMKCTWSLPSTWQELTREIESGKRIIATHIDMIEQSKTTVAEFVDMVRTLVKFMPNSDPLIIGVVITKTTNLKVVQELQKTDITGLLLDVNQYAISEVAQAISALIEGTPYWPEHIISQLPKVENSDKPLCVYFRNDWQKKLSAETLDKLTNSTLWKTVLCDSFDELTKLIELNPKQLAFHIDLVTKHGVTVTEFVSMIETLVKMHDTAIPIAVVVNKTTSIKVIKDLKTNGICGIIPEAETFGIDEAYAAALAIFHGEQYWPKHIISQLPGNTPTSALKNNSIMLTPRQDQIATLICQRGLSNKRVANMLDITESTVKAHVSAILKAYGVRTRTQLVLSVTKENRP